MPWQSHAHTEQGPVRNRNEDALLADDAQQCWLVADGMGGHAGGDVASRLACESIVAALASGTTLAAAIRQAHDKILAHATAHPETQGMGTTLVAAHTKGKKLQLAWVGDSRIYSWQPGDRGLQQLSRDHSFVQDMIDRDVLTPDEARLHPQKNLVNQALGQSNLKRLRIDERLITPEIGQVFLLCTDGVHDMICDTVIAQCLAQEGDLETKANALCEAVLATEASDNFSFILLQHVPRQWWPTRIKT